jgi:hypothetical protein
VKIVPVLEASAAQATAPLEVQVTRTPDGEAMGSAPEPTDSAQPLTLEPTSGTLRAEANRNAPPSANASAPSAHLDWSDPQPSFGMRPTQSPMLQQGATSPTYRYAPEIGVHVVRPDRNGAQGARRDGRGRPPR